MSYCPRPSKTSKTNYTTPAKKTVTPGAPRTENCGPSQSTVIGAGGQNTSTTVYVPGPAGPQGEKGADGDDGYGVFWIGEWEAGLIYEAQDPIETPPTTTTTTTSTGPDGNPVVTVSTKVKVYNADAVHVDGSSYICIKTHTASASNRPQAEDFTGPTEWKTYWDYLAQKGTGSGGATTPEEKTILDRINDVYDWFKNASLEDLLLAGAIAAGVVWAGSKVVDMMKGSVTNNAPADSRFPGGPGYVTTNFTPPTLKAVLTSLCQIQGIAFDVSAINDTDVCTFTIGTITSIRNILDQLALAYKFEMVDTGGVLRFAPRSAAPVMTIDLADMGVGSDGTSSPPVAYQSKRYQGIDLPKQVVLSYYDDTVDYNVMTQTAVLDLYDDGQLVNLSVPVTLTAAQAKEVAELTLVQSWLEAKNYAWTTSYKYIQLEPGDVVSSDMGLTRITKIEETAEGILSFEGVDAGAAESLNQSNLTPVLPPESTNIPTVIGYSQAFYIDPNNINDQDTAIRIKVAVHGYDAAGWPGADIYCSTDGGATSTIVGTAFKEATLGLVEAITPTHDYHGIDKDTVIQVQMRTNSLSNATELSMLNGSNLCMVGQEIMAFETATLVSPGVYNISGLLRGRQGTEQYVSTHKANELFVMLDDALIDIDWNLNDRFTTKKYKVVTKGSSPDKVDWEDVYMVSNNTLMWPVLNAKVLKTGADFTFSWGESVRYDNSLKDLSTALHDPDWAGWGIIIYAPDGVTAKRTITPITQESYVYTAAMQLADFGVAQTTIKASITQISQKYGPGYPVSVSV